MDEIDLRRQLRRLPAEMDPPADLWPGIAARLEPRVAAPRRRGWLPGLLALAACLCVAVGIAYQARTPPGPPAAVALQAELVRREADALTREYDAALRELQGAPVPAPLQPAIATLDDSAREIRGALAQDPDAVFLLDQLRRTYARRLSLTQRAATG